MTFDLIGHGAPLRGLSPTDCSCRHTLMSSPPALGSGSEEHISTAGYLRPLRRLLEIRIQPYAAVKSVCRMLKPRQQQAFPSFSEVQERRLLDLQRVSCFQIPDRATCSCLVPKRVCVCPCFAIEMNGRKVLVTECDRKGYTPVSKLMMARASVSEDVSKLCDETTSRFLRPKASVRSKFQRQVAVGLVGNVHNQSETKNDKGGVSSSSPSTSTLIPFTIVSRQSATADVIAKQGRKMLPIQVQTQRNGDVRVVLNR